MPSVDPVKENTAAPSIAAGESPRFFIELNEPVALLGFNPEGFGVPLFLSAAFAGLGMWAAVGVLMLVGVYLCKRMADNPTILKEWVARQGRSRYVVPNPRDGFDPIRIVTDKGAMGPGQWLAQYVHSGAGEPQPRTRAKAKRKEFY